MRLGVLELRARGAGRRDGSAKGAAQSTAAERGARGASAAPRARLGLAGCEAAGDALRVDREHPGLHPGETRVVEGAEGARARAGAEALAEAEGLLEVAARGVLGRWGGGAFL